MKDPKHVERPFLASWHPVHVVWCVKDDVPRLRQRCFYEAIRTVLIRYLDRVDMRVVNISIQHNHLHLIVEARHKLALTRRLQSFAINCARAINKACDRTGKVFKFRYRAKQIRSLQYARNATAYVLNNWRKHKEHWLSPNQTFDDYASAHAFTGWKLDNDDAFGEFDPLPVSQPRTPLLRRIGSIDPWEVPGSPRSKPAIGS